MSGDSSKSTHKHILMSLKLFAKKKQDILKKILKRFLDNIYLESIKNILINVFIF